jgi:hypothetical protein
VAATSAEPTRPFAVWRPHVHADSHRPVLVGQPLERRAFETHVSNLPRLRLDERDRFHSRTRHPHVVQRIDGDAVLILVARRNVGRIRDWVERVRAGLCIELQRTAVRRRPGIPLRVDVDMTAAFRHPFRKREMYELLGLRVEHQDRPVGLPALVDVVVLIAPDAVRARGHALLVRHRVIGPLAGARIELAGRASHAAVVGHPDVALAVDPVVTRALAFPAR